MIAAKAKVKFDAGKVKRVAQKGSITSLGHAGAAIRLTARRSIKKSAKPSASVLPPHTREALTAKIPGIATADSGGDGQERRRGDSMERIVEEERQRRRRRGRPARRVAQQRGSGAERSGPWGADQQRDQVRLRKLWAQSVKGR